jgi:ribonuclease HI
VTLFTDGACLGNPGPGGYGAILACNGHRREVSGGFRRTTNNRMELTAVLEGLAALKRPCRVRIVSDSQYVIRAMTLGWAARWSRNGWMRTRRDAVENADLWRRLLDALRPCVATFEWVRGHAGHPENERADVLATTAARGKDLPPDEAFESGATTVASAPGRAGLPAGRDGWLDL